MPYTGFYLGETFSQIHILIYWGESMSKEITVKKLDGVLPPEPFHAYF